MVLYNNNDNLKQIENVFISSILKTEDWNGEEISKIIDILEFLLIKMKSNSFLH
jgi:hypothetical protein